jgi:hypothetical protein
MPVFFQLMNHIASETVKKSPMLRKITDPINLVDTYLGHKKTTRLHHLECETFELSTYYRSWQGKSMKKRILFTSGFKL